MNDQFNRRDFLSKLGVSVAGAIVIGPQLSGCGPVDPAAATSADHRAQADADAITDDNTAASIGVYVPQADSDAVEQFVAAMSTARARRAEQGGPTRLVVKRFQGAAPKAAQLRAFIDDYGLDAVVALTNTVAAAPLVEVLHQTKTPLLVAGAGLELPAEQVLASPWAFSLSGGGWEASYAAGVYSARRYGARATVAAMSKEASYDAVFAFHEGFSEVSGRPPAIELIDAPAFDRSAAEVLDAIWARRPSSLYTLASGDEGAAFLRELRAHRGLSAVPTISTGFADAADAFSALGADAFAWLDAALDDQPEGPIAPEALADALAGAQFDNDSGRYQLDSDSGRLVAPIFQQTPHAAALEQLALPDDLHARLLAKLAHPRSGSIDVYLG